MSVTIEVKSLGPISYAKLEVNGLCLVFGPNRAGKTTLARSVGAALTQRPLTRIAKKSEGQLIVSHGKAQGSCIVSNQNGQTSVEWPSCGVQADGIAPPISSVVAAGLIRFSALTPAQRSMGLVGLLKAEPTQADFARQLDALQISPQATVKLWKSIEESGWDAVEAARREAGTKMKGRWEGVTKSGNWGEKKGAAFMPQGLIEGLSAEQIDAQIATARAALEGAVGKQAVSAEKVQRLGQINDELGQRKALHQQRLDALARAQQANQDAQKAIDALEPLPTDFGLCPHCQQPVTPRVKDDSGRWVIDKASAATSNTELVALRKRHEQANEARDDSRRKLAAAMKTMNDARVLVEEAERAGIELGELQGRDQQEDVGDVEAARRRVLELEVARDAAKAKHEADELHRSIVANIAVIEVLGPNGLRKQMLRNALDAWLQEKVIPYARAFGMKGIVIDSDMQVFVEDERGEMPFSMCSASQQFQVDVAFQMAWALTDESRVIVIDAADILFGSHRSGMLKALAASKQDILITVSAGSPKGQPDLGPMGVGSSWWLSGGEVEPLADAASRLAAAAKKAV